MRLENLAPEIKGEQQTSSMSRQELVTALQSCRAEQVKMAATVQSLQQANRALQSKCDGMEARGGGVMAEAQPPQGLVAASPSYRLLLGRRVLLLSLLVNACAAWLALASPALSATPPRPPCASSDESIAAPAPVRPTPDRATCHACYMRGSAPGSAPLSARLLLASGWEWR